MKMCIPERPNGFWQWLSVRKHIGINKNHVPS